MNALDKLIFAHFGDRLMVSQRAAAKLIAKEYVRYVVTRICADRHWARIWREETDEIPFKDCMETEAGKKAFERALIRALSEIPL